MSLRIGWIVITGFVKFCEIWEWSPAWDRGERHGGIPGPRSGTSVWSHVEGDLYLKGYFPFSVGPITLIRFPQFTEVKGLEPNSEPHPFHITSTSENLNLNGTKIIKILYI